MLIGSMGSHTISNDTNTPQDSTDVSVYRRSGKKTASEILFDEIPVFSDSEEEEEYNKLILKQIPHFYFSNNKQKHISISEPDPTLLLEKIMGAFRDCCKHCHCCNKIKEVLPLFSSASSSSSDSGIAVGSNDILTQRKELSTDALNTCKNINILSCQKLCAPTSTKSPTIIHSTTVPENIEINTVLPVASSKKVKRKKRNYSEQKSKTKKRKKITQSNTDFQSYDLNEIQNVNTDNVTDNNTTISGFWSVTVEKLVDKTIGEIEMEKDNRPMTMQLRSTRSITRKTTDKKIDLAHTRKDKKGIGGDEDLEKIAGKSPPSTIPKENGDQPLVNEALEKEIVTEMENLSNKLITVDNGQSRANEEQILKLRESPRKSSSPKFKSPSTIILLRPHMKSGKSSKESKELAAYADERVQTRTSTKSLIDSNIYNIPIDTTMNRSFNRGFLRKLARSGMKRKSVNEGFRSLQHTSKLRKLYSSSEWLNSKEFSRLMED